MPQECRSEDGSHVGALLFCVDNMNVLQTRSLGNRGRGMLVQSTKVRTEFSLLVDIQVVLVAEEDDTPGSDQAGKIVLLRVIELRQPHS